LSAVAAALLRQAAAASSLPSSLDGCWSFSKVGRRHDTYLVRTFTVSNARGGESFEVNHALLGKGAGCELLALQNELEEERLAKLKVTRGGKAAHSVG
jgi:hypothetical protein